MRYENILLTSSMYQEDGGITGALERLDPSKGYISTDDPSLVSLDAYQRQLKRFDIKVIGKESNLLSEFFVCNDSAILFPEYIMRAIAKNEMSSNVLNEIVASKSTINSMSYHSITAQDAKGLVAIENQVEELYVDIESMAEPIRMRKRGRILRSTYDSVKDRRLDIFTIIIKQIGNSIIQNFVSDAIEVMIESKPAVTKSHKPWIQYQDIVDLWCSFNDFEMNVLLASPDMARDIMMLPEFRTSESEVVSTADVIQSYLKTRLIKNSAVPEGTIIAIDRNYALEMASVEDIAVEYDKLIKKDFERTSISSTRGFSVIFPGAIKILKRSAK